MRNPTEDAVRKMLEQLAADLRLLVQVRAAPLRDTGTTLGSISKAASDHAREAAARIHDGGVPPTSTPTPPAHPRTHHGFRRFDTMQEASRYGEQRLGPVRDRLPPELFEAVRKYTRWSYPLNKVRVDPQEWLDKVGSAKAKYDQLLPLTGANPVPTLRELVSISRRGDLSDEQKRLISRLAAGPDPNGDLDEVWIDEFVYRRLENYLEAPPSPTTLYELLDRVDRAVEQPLPDPIHAVRGLHSLEHLVDINGNPLGPNPTREQLEALRGSVQTDKGYLSCSLGPEPAVISGSPYKHHLELDIPEQSLGLWMGEKSQFPDQRELILARDTRYVVTDFSGNEDNGFVVDAEVLPRAA